MYTKAKGERKRPKKLKNEREENNNLRWDIDKESVNWLTYVAQDENWETKNLVVRRRLL